jgi:hypothetical protein
MKLKETNTIPPGWKPGDPLPQQWKTVRPRPAPVAESDWVVWDDLCQVVRVEGFARVVAHCANAARTDHEYVVIRKRDGGFRNLTAAEQRRLSDAVVEATE